YVSLNETKLGNTDKNDLSCLIHHASRSMIRPAGSSDCERSSSAFSTSTILMLRAALLVSSSSSI
ncbi:hypothetical protein NPIL_376381, partial [Nephila pilipes]